MRFNTLFVLLVLSFACLAAAQVMYEDCCLRYGNGIENRVRKHVVRYRLQITDGGCNIPAVIFTMKRGRKLCANPKDSWVMEVVKKLDATKHPNHLLGVNNGNGRRIAKLRKSRT